MYFSHLITDTNISTSILWHLELGKSMAYHQSPTALEEGELKDFDSKTKVTEESSTNVEVEALNVVRVQTPINKCASFKRLKAILVICMGVRKKYRQQNIASKISPAIYRQAKYRQSIISPVNNIASNISPGKISPVNNIASK